MRLVALIPESSLILRVSFAVASLICVKRPSAFFKKPSAYHPATIRFRQDFDCIAAGAPACGVEDNDREPDAAQHVRSSMGLICKRAVVDRPSLHQDGELDAARRPDP